MTPITRAESSGVLSVDIALARHIPGGLITTQTVAIEARAISVRVQRCIGVGTNGARGGRTRTATTANTAHLDTVGHAGANRSRNQQEVIDSDNGIGNCVNDEIRTRGKMYRSLLQLSDAKRERNTRLPEIVNVADNQTRVNFLQKTV